MYEMHRVVTSSDCDETGYQTPTSLVTMMQDCPSLWLESEPVIDNYIRENDIALIITSRQMDIYRRPAYRERITVKTSVYQFRGPLGYRNTFIYDERGEVVAKSWSSGPYFDLAQNKMLKLPDEIVNTTVIDPKLDMEYLPRKIALPSAEPTELPTVPVVPSDIDYYHHVNNAQYVLMAIDALSGRGIDAPLARLSVQYRNMARLGDTVVPSIYGCEGGHDVELNDTEGNTYAVVRFQER